MAAARQASGTLYGMVQQQAAMMAYLDIFYLLAWGACLLISLVVLLRKTSPGDTAAIH